MFVAPPPARVEANTTYEPSGLHDGATALLESPTSGVGAGAPAPRVRMKRPARPCAVETNTIRSPDGAQLGLASIDPANPTPAVRGCGFVPSAADSHSLGTPLSSLRYAMCRPSGESAGWVSLAAVVVRRCSVPPPPVEGTAYSSPFP